MCMQLLFGPHPAEYPHNLLYVQHMPIFEEREILGVKTLKSFADIKKELVMFSIVKYGRSSSLMDLKVIFP